MAFRTYNYDKNEVQLAARDTQVIIDQFYYQSNGEWDLIFCPAKSTSNDAVEEVTFFFIFRRKSLFYVRSEKKKKSYFLLSDYHFCGSLYFDHSLVRWDVHYSCCLKSKDPPCDFRFHGTDW